MLLRSTGLTLITIIAMNLSATAHHHAKSTKVKIVPEAETWPGHEKDTYRYGQIIGAMRGASPRDCEIVCSQNRMCASWTYLPATFESGPICELKGTIGQQSYRPGAYTGIALRLQPGAPQIPPPVQMSRPVPPPPKPTSTVLKTVKAPPPSSGLMGGPETPAPVSKPLAPLPKPVAKPVPVPVPAPAPPAPDLTETELAPAPLPQTVLAPKSPPGPEATRKVPQFQMVPAPEETSVPPAPLPPTAPPVEPVITIEPEPAPAPTARKPWTERDGDEVGYSVGGLDYVPGDEQATAGYGNEFADSN